MNGTWVTTGQTLEVKSGPDCKLFHLCLHLQKALSPKRPGLTPSSSLSQKRKKNKFRKRLPRASASQPSRSESPSLIRAPIRRVFLERAIILVEESDGLSSQRLLDKLSEPAASRGGSPPSLPEYNHDILDELSHLLRTSNGHEHACTHLKTRLCTRAGPLYTSLRTDPGVLRRLKNSSMVDYLPKRDFREPHNF